MTEQEYRETFSEDESVGWDAIDAELEKLYGDTEPRHYGSIIKYWMGGEDPLDGTSIYDCKEQTPHRHIISYGMSELYFSPESADTEFSKWGFEFTFRITPCKLDPASDSGTPHEPFWAINLMNNLARYVFESEKWFEPYHFIPTNSPIRSDTETALVGIAFVPDPKLPAIDTPNGKVDFLQMVGLTQSELDWLWQEPSTARCKELIDKMRVDNPLLITDLARTRSYV